MNSLDDLRTTLRVHAHDLDGLDPVSRSVGVQTKVAEQRRRRNAVRGGVALAAVAAVVTGVVLTDLGSGPTPDPATTLGAPESFTAVGWTYAFADAVESDGPSQTISLPESERPYLISWKTEGESQDVTVTSEVESDSHSDGDSSIWTSSAADWADHVVVHARQAEKITVSAMDRGVDAIAVATYEIDPTRAPAGKGSGKADGFHFREKVADQVLVDAAVVEDRTEVSFDYSVPDSTVSLVHSCSGVPKNAWVRISLDGSDEATTFSQGCLHDGFDPGAGSEYRFPAGEGKWPSDGTVRMWVSRSETDLTPIPASELPGVKLGVGLYLNTASEQVWDTEFDTRLESSGHTWEWVETVPVDSGGMFLLDTHKGSSGDISPWLLHTAHETSGGGLVSLTVETDDEEMRGPFLSSKRKEVAVVGGTLLPPWTPRVGIKVTEGADIVTRQALILYRLAD